MNTIVKIIGTISFLLVVYFEIYGDSHSYRPIVLTVGVLSLTLHLILEYIRWKRSRGAK